MLFEADADGGVTPLPDGSPVPDGAYTTFRTYGGRRVLLFDLHVQRLRESVRLQGRSAPLSQGRAARAVGAALTQAGFAETRVRLTFAPPRLFVAVSPFEPLPQELYANGAVCVSVPVQRAEPQAKDTRFLETAAAAYRALPEGVHEGLMHDASGALLEGLTSNFFALLDGELRTEEQRVLAGVTRSVVLELARGIVPLRREPVRLADLPRVSEAFLTSVSRGVVPVTRIDGRAVCDGAPGPVTRHLMRQYAELAEQTAQPIDQLSR